MTMIDFANRSTRSSVYTVIYLSRTTIVCYWPQWLLAAFGLAACAAVEFEQRPQRRQLQLAAGGDDPDSVHYYGRPAVAVQQQPAAADEESSRTHHGKHKLKKLKKRLLLQCLLGHGRRRRRDTDAASGRFLLPIVLQSTNVNVHSGGSGGGAYGDPQHQYGGSSGCMEMMSNDHGPLLGSLGSGLGGLLGSPAEDAGTGGGSRGSLYSADWNRYARQFHRNYVRPLYRLF